MRSRCNRLDVLHRALGGAALPAPGELDAEALALRLDVTRGEVLRMLRDAREAEGLRSLRGVL